ncbi:MAG: HEPN domain-containing protein, partial [Armatimonadota bacterium]|nr:HEPN domain-containing protein [Armatimonadota bacterium]
PSKGSDIDILIVLRKPPKKDGFFERIELVSKLIEPSCKLPRLEIHIMTADELSNELSRRNVFLADVIMRGIPIFSRREWDEVLKEVEKLMELGNSLYPLDWLSWAQMDLQCAKLLLAHQDIYNAAYHMHQAIEKLLKAYLLSRGWNLERTHDLVHLLNVASSHSRELSKFKVLCEMANSFHLARYPRAIKPPTVQELEELLAMLDELHGIVSNELLRQ